jgi:hypothetical protein
MNKINFISFGGRLVPMLAVYVLFVFAGCAATYDKGGESRNETTQANGTQQTENVSTKENFTAIGMIVTFLGIFVTFLGIFGTFLISSLNLIICLTTSKKTRFNNIASTRRKERIDNFIIYYSKISALVCPDTVKAYVLNNDCSFSERLIENSANLNMLFDHRFQKDTEFANLIGKLVEEAIAYYSSGKSDGFSEDLVSKYKEEYFKNIKEADKLLNIYIGTEWERLKKEAQEGRAVNLEEWEKLYEESERAFEKWNNVNLSIKSNFPKNGK